LKKSRNGFSGLLEPGNILDIVFYYKASRSVQNLTKASFRAKTFDIHLNMEKMAVSTAALEMVDQLVVEDQGHDELFFFTEKLLIWLHQTKKTLRTLFPYIQLRLAELMGIGLRYEFMDNRSVMYLNIDEGNISALHGTGLSYRLTSGQASYIKTGLGPKNGLLTQSELTSRELKNLIFHLDVYLKHHIEGLRDRKSDKIFHQIL
ncbi:MAG: DNA repair protein RecO C-terminal domain-containing protein, partial [Balneolales bacterium]